MKNLIGIFTVLLFTTKAFSNSGYSIEGAGGLEFSKTDSISLESEILTITPNKIKIDYIFFNTSGKDIDALVTFPLPEIKCGWFEMNNHPENFSTTVNGEPVKYKVEKKALFSGPGSDKYKNNQDITDFLESNNISIDCRDIEKNGLGIEDLEKKNISDSHKKLIALGLAADVIEYDDPWSINYKTMLKYYWTQKFPANSKVEITHSYTPSFGAGNKGLRHERSVLENIELYKALYNSDPGLSELADKYHGNNGYILITYILQTANTWKGPIKHFELRFKKPVTFMASNMDGEPTLEKGDIVIRKKDFVPSFDLKAVYFSPTSYFKDIAGVERLKF